MLVFVYGTLRKDDCRNGVLEGYECPHPEAYLEGFQMLSLGSFPGIVPGDGRIRGEIYDIDQSCLRRLDMIEGYRADDPRHSLYRREKVQVLTPEDNYVEVFTYVFNRNIEDRDVTIIKSGDWLESKHAPESYNAVP